jgi:hypothetical protein
LTVFVSCCFLTASLMPTVKTAKTAQKTPVGTNCLCKKTRNRAAHSAGLWQNTRTALAAKQLEKQRRCLKQRSFRVPSEKKTKKTSHTIDILS